MGLEIYVKVPLSSETLISAVIRWEFHVDSGKVEDENDTMHPKSSSATAQSSRKGRDRKSFNVTDEQLGIENWIYIIWGGLEKKTEKWPKDSWPEIKANGKVCKSLEGEIHDVVVCFVFGLFKSTISL